MDSLEINISSFGLRNKDVDVLRNMAVRFLNLSDTEAKLLKKTPLLSKLSEESINNPDLQNEIKKCELAFKPSFYVMILNSKEQEIPNPADVYPLLNEEFKKKDEKKSSSSEKEYKVIGIDNRPNRIVEIKITWQQIHWYWNPEGFKKSHIYELKFGLAILNYVSKKAIIACQNEHERKTISVAINKIYSIELTPLVLTKPLLNQIGEFDYVKRAGYFINDPDATTPSNITYADENLATKTIARIEEENSRSQRKYSFYILPLGTIQEQGVGVTSDSGKLWIPREIPITSIREYGVALLDRIGQTLNQMTDREEFENIIESMGIAHLPKFSEISNISLRAEIYRLIIMLINMLLANNEIKPFQIKEIIAKDAIPDLFLNPRIQLTDYDTGDISYWADSESKSQFIRIISKYGDLQVNSFPNNQKLDLSQLTHPITNSKVVVDNIFDNLDLVPTTKLHEIIMESVKHVSNQIGQLKQVVCVPFRISVNQILLDVNRAYGKKGASMMDVKINAPDLIELRQALSHSLDQRKKDSIKIILRQLGEKCNHINDDNCLSCLQDKKFICLRSLVARYLKNTTILSHKGIELSDIQAEASIGNEKIRILGFAKLANGKNNSLTARNENGANLLSQVLGQVDKTTFDTVLIISPSILNEDLRQRLEMVCSVFNKHLLFFDLDVLAELLNDFEIQAEFDGLDFEKMYESSSKNASKSKKRN